MEKHILLDKKYSKKQTELKELRQNNCLLFIAFFAIIYLFILFLINILFFSPSTFSSKIQKIPQKHWTELNWYESQGGTSDVLLSTFDFPRNLIRSTDRYE